MIQVLSAKASNTVQEKRTGAAAAQLRNSFSLQDNRNLFPLQQKTITDNRVVQSSTPSVLQAKWKDKNGVEHEGNPPEGWQWASNTLIGDHWVPPTIVSNDGKTNSDYPEKEEKKENQEKKVNENESEDEGYSGSEEDNEGGFDDFNDDDFQFDEKEHERLMSDPSEKVRGKSGEYRAGRRFFEDRKRNTRKNLEKRQTGKDGLLRSGFDGKGEVINRDSEGREKRTHKTPNAKNRRPDIDHKMDWVLLDEMIDQYEHDESSMSEADLETFKDIVYNHEDNLEILSHEDHKEKKRTTRDNLTDRDKEKALKFVKERREEYKNDDDAQERRDNKRERLKKKRKREESNEDKLPNKKKKDNPDDEDTDTDKGTDAKL